VRDRTFDEDRSQVRTGASPQFLATARNIAISLLRMAGCLSVPQGMEHLARRLDSVLALLGVLPQRSRKEVVIKRRSLACDFAEDPGLGRSVRSPGPISAIQACMSTGSSKTAPNCDARRSAR